MKIKKLLTGLIFIILISGQIFGQSQGVSITLDNSPPHESAMLDIDNPNKGILIPRVALLSPTQPVANPVEGLLVYNTDETTYPKGFYYWTGQVWNKLSTGDDLALTGNQLQVGTGTPVDLSGYLPLTETQVDNYVTNNGYLTAETDPVFNVSQAKNLTNSGSGQVITDTERNIVNGFDITTPSDGQLLKYDATSGKWKNHTREIAVFHEIRDIGVTGDFPSSEWITREINTTHFNNSAAIDIIGNIIRLQPGTYHILASSPGYRVGRHQIRFMNISNGTEVSRGTLSHSGSTYATESKSEMISIFTIDSTTDFELQHYCESSHPDGLGVTGTWSEGIYTTIQIEKLD